MSDRLQVNAQGSHEIVMTRSFDAPRARVFEALTSPSLLRRWLLGPPGWEMAVCELQAQVGDTYRYVWRNVSDGTEFGVGGKFREISALERIVHTERFDQPWYPGEAVITTILAENGGTTTLTATLRYETQDARDAVLKSPMESGERGRRQLRPPGAVPTAASGLALARARQPRAEFPP
jgi:uncharacterized protein YndB with AHSA1/START domain